MTLGADKAYDTSDFVADMRAKGVIAHVAQNTKGRRLAIDGRTARHASYGISRRKRKRIEEVFGRTRRRVNLKGRWYYPERQRELRETPQFWPFFRSL